MQDKGHFTVQCTYNRLSDGEAQARVLNKEGVGSVLTWIRRYLRSCTNGSNTAGSNITTTLSDEEGS